MLNVIKKNPAIFIFLLIILAYFHKMFSGYVPIPMDILTGAYFPWLDYKWGYSVGVPVTNPSLSDVYSQLYPWRELAVNLLRQGQFPLWNIYSFSGTPLLADWQSAPLYPLNLLMLLLGNAYGWSLMVVMQVILSLVFMYLFLTGKGFNKSSTITAAVVFAFSGFMTNYMQYATIGQSFLWLPLVLFFLDKFFKSKNSNYLLIIPVLVFCIITAGSFQAALYAILIILIYAIYSTWAIIKDQKTRVTTLLKISIFIFWGIMLSAIQLIPTFELLNLSIRELDHNIIEYKYGLLPLQNLLTFISPDFFGNPATGNFWGFMGYQETAGYFGVTSLVFVIIAIWKTIKEKKREYFYLVGLFIISLLLIIDNPLSRLIYTLNIPVFSTSYATRMLLFVTFSASILTAIGLANLEKYKKETLLITLFIFGMVVTILIATYLKLNSLDASQLQALKTDENLKVAFKNTLVPAALIGALLLGQLFIKKKVLLVSFIVFLVIVDNFRFSYKVLDFSKSNLVFPNTPVISFLKENIGYYRFDREKSEVMPPNSWVGYELMSPSGYDPLYPRQYAAFHSVYNNGEPNGGFSRYAELENYNSPFIDLAGVKYLAVAKRDKDGVIKKEVESISYKIDQQKYKKVFEDKTVVILENSSVHPRVSFYTNYVIEPDYTKALRNLKKKEFDFRKTISLNSSPAIKSSRDKINSSFEIEDYEANKVKIKTKTDKDSIMMLTDSYYTGWDVYVDNKKSKLLTADGIFRAVEVPLGEHQVSFIYQPRSFQNGLIISGSSLVSLLILFLYRKLHLRI